MAAASVIFGLAAMGTRRYFSGSKYEGEFRDGLRHGHGEKTWPNGNRCAWVGSSVLGRGAAG